MHTKRLPASDGNTSIPACCTDQASFAVYLAVRQGVHALGSWDPRPGCCATMAIWGAALASAGNIIAASP